jgi:uncharacterized membrane protein
MDDQNQTPVTTPVEPTVAPQVPTSPEPTMAPEVPTSPAPVQIEPTPIPEVKPVATGIVTKGEKTLAMFGYVEFLCVLPLVLKPKSRYCQFHGKQSLVLVLFFFILSWIGWIVPAVGMLIAFVHIAIIIVAMVQASQGKLWRIPFVAQVADKLNWDE